MNFMGIKSFERLARNPHLSLLFVVYLLIIVSLWPLLIRAWGTNTFIVLLLLIMLFTSAFFAGWFGLVKCAVACEDSKEDIQKRYDAYKAAFFASIPVYMFSLILFTFLLWLIYKFLWWASGMLFPMSEEQIRQYIAIVNSSDSLSSLVKNCPPEITNLLLKRGLFLYGGISLYLFAMLYSIPALYFNKSKNPLIALKNGILAIIKKPLGTIFLFVSILVCHLIISYIEAISLGFEIIAFLALVLRVCFTAYVVMLLFSVYEANFTDNSNNRTDCIRENEPCN